MTKVTAKISVEGTKTILFHTFPMDTFSTNKEKKGKTGDNNEEWKETVLMNENRQLFVYNTYFQASISEGGKEIKIGKSNLFRKVCGTLEVLESKIFMEDLFVPGDENLSRNDSEPVYLDVRAVVNPMTKGRNLRYRIAARPGWKCSFTVCWDDRILSKDQIKQCAENGGAFQGIGDGRKIGFGRYKITEFKAFKD